MFNRIAGTSIAVVYDQPGVTRDRLYTRAFWGDKEFVMIDTGKCMWGDGLGDMLGGRGGGVGCGIRAEVDRLGETEIPLCEGG